ncbi:MAG: c-type cytochrome [Longimicrobiales bacterium]
MKRVMLAGLFAAASFAVLGFMIAASGLVPIGASSGHWAITRWFLDFSKHRSIATHSIGIDVPPLGDSAQIVRGAAHYETGCRPCHGAPGGDRWKSADRMAPNPPGLDLAVAEWEPEELFYITRHGLKFTGMPAWPAQQRDDEVWDEVAFMLALPRLDSLAYHALAFGEVADPDVSIIQSDSQTDAHEAAATLAGAPTPAVGESLELALEGCRRCHGRTGRGRSIAAFPRLAGQSAAYLAASLDAFVSGARHSGFMQTAVASLDPGSVRELANYFASLEPDPQSIAGLDPSAGDTAVASHEMVVAGDTMVAGDTIARGDAIARGGAIANTGIPERKVPACGPCHGPTPWPRNPRYPILEGQNAPYIAQQLRLFRENRRGGSEYAHIMLVIAPKLTDREIDAIAAYYASLGNER